jgi:hypothetical protein
MIRRRFLVTLGAALGALLVPFGAADAGILRRRKRRHRRRVRRRIRRRHRRRVAYRMSHGRRVLICPIAVAVGWELAMDDRVVVVKEVRVVEKDGAKQETVLVTPVDAAPDAKPEEIAIVREDTKENGEELEGSVLPEGDEETPGVTTEIEVEVDDDSDDEDEKDEKDD